MNAVPAAPPDTPFAAHPLTLLFAASLVLWLAVELWLATRQMRHVARHAGQVPQGFESTVTPEAHRRAAQYTVARGRVSLLASAFGAAVLLGWTLLGGLDALNQAVMAALAWFGWAGPVSTLHGVAYGVLLIGAFAVVSALLDLPFEVWRTFGVEQRFGFNRTTVSLFVADLAKGAVLSVLMGLPILALILWLMGVAGQAWWLWAWGCWMAFTLLVTVLYPTVIAPWFNRFQPLADEGLKDRVGRLMARCGFAAKGLYVMDGSRRSAHGNAYFTGFGAAKRVVFYDTLLATLTGDEVEAVLAHELGHFKLRHIAQRLVMMAVVTLVGFALIGWLSSRLWFYAALGVQPSVALPNDALALLLFMLVLPVFTFWVSPLTAGLSRRHEFQADAYAARMASGPALASALIKLHKDNASTLTPDPLYASFHYSHPPAAERLAAIRALPVAVGTAPAASQTIRPNPAAP
jgi:STE24 endopeptidase